MITTNNFACKEEILQGIQLAKANDQTTLVSIVKKVSKLDPLKFFAAGYKTMNGERFFWKAASTENYLVGHGICQPVNMNGFKDQFTHINEEWRKIVDNSLIFNEYKTEGVGPILFGGFSFDPQKDKTSLWKNYYDTSFRIPKFLLTKIENETYLTINVLCTKNDNENLVENINKTLDELFTSMNNLPQFKNAEILKEEEIKAEEWKLSVTKVEEELRQAPSLKKVVLARELRLYFSEKVSIENVINELLTEQTDSYVFALEANNDCFIGATPERLIRKRDQLINTTCLAGSIGRGKTKEEDERLGETLLTDNKNLIEHQYVVDMITDAIKENCSDVIIPDKPVLLKVRDIQHLYTPIVARGKEDTSLFKLVGRLHPTPAIGGLPKMEAVEKIREIEHLDRGLYAGPIGWIDYNQNGEFAVALRSALVQSDEASLFAGCGVVIGSDADDEYEETSIKFRPMLTALGRNN